MNIQTKLSCGSDKLDCVKDYLFDQIKKAVIEREIEIFQMQNENKYTSGKDSEFITWLNSSTYARCFSRICLRASLQDRWASITEVTTTLRCDDKTARNMYQKFMDNKMIERDRNSEKLLFKATSLGLEIFDRYVELLYCNRGEGLYDHIVDLLQYMKLTRKGGSDYQEKRE
jgi:predicted transcriptional regulator